MTAWCDIALRHRLGTFRSDVALGLGREIGVLFGPSGAGKSLLLRLLAGLEYPAEGFLRLGDRILIDVSKGLFVPSRQRRIGMVFQQLALFPHKTVMDNVAYGIRGQDRHPAALARHWLQRVHLEGFENRFPSQLSGGQRQRVALARALAAEPELLLLDEPFSALDGPLRRSLRRELRHLHEETGVPILYVTHAIEDACALGHTVFFLQDGRCTGQVRVEDLWNGSCQEKIFNALRWGNLLVGDVVFKDFRWCFVWPGGTLTLVPGERRPGAGKAFVAPQDVKLLYEGLVVDEDLRSNVFEGRVAECLSLGSFRRLYVEAPSGTWQVEFPTDAYGGMSLAEGQHVRFAVCPSQVVLLDDGRKEWGV